MAVPPAAAVRSFRHRNSVDPGLQAGLAVEGFHCSEDLQEDFLCGIGGISRSGDDAVYQAVNRLVKLADQPGVGVFGAGLEFGNDRRFLAPDCYRACKIAQGSCPRHNPRGVILIIVSFRTGSPPENYPSLPLAE